MYEHLLIDVRNALYRAIYAGMADTERHDDLVTIFFRFLCSYVHKFRPKQVHAFWDSPKDTVWRRKVMVEYKEERDISHKGKYSHEDIEAELNRCTDVALRVLQYLNCRNYAKVGQEADDLIYAFCRQQRNSKMVIVSSDSDFRQISYYQNNVDIYSPLNNKNKEISEIETINPIEVKSFMGERSDNISGYHQIGPVRAAQLVSDYIKRMEFFDINGSDIYKRNMQLIDLSLNPHLLDNQMYISSVLARTPVFDQVLIRDIIQKYKVRGLMGEFNQVLIPFKFINSNGE